VVGTIGLLCVYAEWGWNGLVMSACTVGTVAGAIGVSVWAENGFPTAVRVTRAIAAGGWLLTAATGLVAAFHVAGAFVVALLALLTPDLVSLVRRRSVADAVGERPPEADPSSPSTTAPDETAPHRTRAGSPSLLLPLDVEALDDEGLCLAWRRSFLLLERADSAEDSMAVVDRRARILDELHRRSPGGVAAWWLSGGRASGDPLPYLGGRRTRIDPGSG